jgi:NAD(P)-dependent dehydrogenase (short-subunit alcohol dehydrogenase family)
MDKERDRGPVILLTGASRGIGAATARHLARSGASLALVARSRTGTEAVAEEVRQLGGAAICIRGDVADREACLDAVARTLETFSRIDALVNNAGVLEPISSLAAADAGKWRYNLEVNLLGPVNLIQAALPALRKASGRIVNVSSGAALNPVVGWSAYCTAKAGLTHLTRVLAAEERSLTVLSLRPGTVDTEMQASIRRDGASGMTPEKVTHFSALKAEGRLVPPEVPARSVAWLALYAPREWSGEFLDYDDPRIESAPSFDPDAETASRSS